MSATVNHAKIARTVANKAIRANRHALRMLEQGAKVLKVPHGFARMMRRQPLTAAYAAKVARG